MNDIYRVHECTRQAYNKIADKYHELFKDEINQKEFDRRILDKFAQGIDRNEPICDAGCGPSGHMGKYLHAKGYNVFGIDISDRCIEIARACNPGMDFKRADMLDLKVTDQSLAAIISFYSIICSPKNGIGLIFRHFYQKLKPGGKLMVVVKKGKGEGFVKEVLGIKTRVYHSLFSEVEIEKYFTDHQFAINHMETRKPYDFEIQVPRIYAIGVK